MSPEVAAIMAQLEALAPHDPSARAALAAIGGRIDADSVGVRDAMLSGWYGEAERALFTGFDVSAEDIILDVGCGDAGVLDFCARHGARMILADVDADRVAKAGQAIAAAPPDRVETHVTDANPLPIADAAVTRVICLDVLDHVEEPAALVAELVRVGRAGARYLLTVPDVAQARLQKHLAPGTHVRATNHARVFERDAFDALVRDAGLVIERKSYDGFFWSMWWLMFWTCDVSVASGISHPVLDHWTRSWSALLDTRDGVRVKHLLDRFLPRSQVIVASKPVLVSLTADGLGCPDHGKLA